MLKKYILINRKRTLYCKSDKQFVDGMRKNDNQFFSDNQTFMDEYAFRKEVFEKLKINTTNENEFVKDLIKNKILLVQKASPWESFYNRVHYKLLKKILRSR